MIRYIISQIYKNKLTTQCVFFSSTAACLGLIPFLYVYSNKIFINGIIEIFKANRSASSEQFIRVLLFLFSVRLAEFLLNILKDLSNNCFALRFKYAIKKALLNKVETLNYTHFESADHYNRLIRAHNGADNKIPLILSNSYEIIKWGISLVSMLLLLIDLSISFVLFAVLFICPILLIQFKFGKERYKIIAKRTEEQRWSSYYSRLLTERQFLQEIRSCGIWTYLFNKWAQYCSKFISQDIKLHKRKVKAQIFLEVGNIFIQLITYVYILKICYSKQMTIGDVLMYIGAFHSLVSGVRIMASSIANIYESRLYVKDLQSFCEHKTDCRLQKENAERIPKIIKCIEFKNISFRYPGASVRVLNNINTKIMRGESVLITGPNGAGKSTLIKLLLRFYEPETGEILINNINLNKFDKSELRDCIAVCFQNYIKFACTAKENIGYGKIDKIDDISHVSSAAEKAGISDCIEALPESYNTTLSKSFDKGVDLSGGEWQKIALARFFMKDSSVFVLDEPTASLDIKSEKYIFNLINNLSKNRICIIISHRATDKIITQKHIILESNGTITEKTNSKIAATVI